MLNIYWACRNSNLNLDYTIHIANIPAPRFYTYLGASLMRANLPKSSPSFRVATTPLPWITTSTEPFNNIYQDRPSSPWLNTACAIRKGKKREKKKKIKINGFFGKKFIIQHMVKKA